jgi:hypothetical protein
LSKPIKPQLPLLNEKYEIIKISKEQQNQILFTYFVFTLKEVSCHTVTVAPGHYLKK